MNYAPILVPDDSLHDEAVEALYSAAFGPGRFAKAAARVREGNVYARNLSFLAFIEAVGAGRQLVGACRLWPIAGSEGGEALFLGPIAVDGIHRSGGVGRALVEACLAAVDATGQAHTIILVGDLDYFGRMGFEIVPDGVVSMPGPVDPKRLLWRRDENAPHIGGRLKARLGP